MRDSRSKTEAVDKGLSDSLERSTGEPEEVVGGEYAFDYQHKL